MKQRSVFILILMLSLSLTSVNAAVEDYNPTLVPNPESNPIITWNIIDAPEVPFSLFFSGQAKWIAESSSTLQLRITNIADDVEGEVTLGNATWSGNDTDIAQDLTLGVWGLTPWLPGFVVPIGSSKMTELNITAFASAERISGNYMNGTMNSSYETVVVGDSSYECLVFHYEQDQFFGEPQITHLAYDTATGVLITANTSYSFGTPYSLVFEISSISTAGMDFTLAVIGGFVIILVFVVILFVRRK